METRVVCETGILNMRKYLLLLAQLFKLHYMHRRPTLTTAHSFDLYLHWASQSSPTLESLSCAEPNTYPLTPLNHALILQPRDP
jgi:hypothetical protein